MFDASIGTFAANKVKRELGASGGIGYVETQTLTNDGSGVGVDLLGDGSLYTKISDNYFEPRTFASVVVVSNGKEWTFGTESATFSQDDPDSPWGMYITGVGTLAVCAPGEGDDGGLFILTNPDLYVKRITFETIHPIDPKYIPALDALYLNGTDGKQYKVTVSDDGALTATEV